MARAKNACLKNIELILGGSIKNAPHDDVIALLILALCKLAAEKRKRRLTGKKCVGKGSRKIAKLLYDEVIRRMNSRKQNKTPA